MTSDLLFLEKFILSNKKAPGFFSTLNDPKSKTNDYFIKLLLAVFCIDTQSSMRNSA